MIITETKPNIKRRPDSSTPFTNKKFKTSGKKHDFDPDISVIQVNPKGENAKSKASNTSGFGKKSIKFGLKSKPFLNKKKTSINQKSFKGNAFKTQATTEGKPNWTEFKQEKKQQKVSRKEKRHGLEVYELSVKAKALWEKLRMKATPVEKKESICQELFQLVKNDVGLLIHSHDLARVVQSLMKYGSPDMHAFVGDKLCQCFVKAASSKYGRFCVKAALKKCSAATRGRLMQCMLGHVVKLFCHKFGNLIVENVYTVWAHGPMKKAMRMEFYGDLGKLLSVPADRKHMLDDLPNDLKSGILTSTKLNINKALDKKNLLKSPLLHAVLLDFLRVCDQQDREEVLEAIHQQIDMLLTSSKGQKVAITCLWHGTNKMKKVAVKSLKGKVQEFAKSKFGHSFIMAMFDSVDDTVLLNKVIIPELLEDLENLIKNEFGRRVVLYLVAHRDPGFFHPQQLAMLREGDSVRNSKKDNKLRLKELLTVASEGILQKICSDPAPWCEDSSSAMVLLAVFKSAQEGKTLEAAYKALVDYILDPQNIVYFKEECKIKVHAVESCGIHMALKKIINHEKEKTENTFAKCLVRSLTDENLTFLLRTNRGAFTLIFILENGDKDTVEKLKSQLIAFSESDLVKPIKRSVGLKVLLKKIE